MSRNIPRDIFYVVKDGGGWAVRAAGKIVYRSFEKDEARADAHKRARKSQDEGRPCMVRVVGEHGFVDPYGSSAPMRA